MNPRDFSRRHANKLAFIILTLGLLAGFRVTFHEFCLADNRSSMAARGLWKTALADPHPQEGFVIINFPPPRGRQRFPVLFDRTNPEDIKTFLKLVDASYPVKDCGLLTTLTG